MKIETTLRERETFRQIGALANKMGGEISFEDYFKARKDAANDLLKMAEELKTLAEEELRKSQVAQTTE